MLRLALALALSLAAPALARGVTDSAGRVVEVPDEVSSVFAAGCRPRCWSTW
jgi:iron complex transport system substrate-binding protein